MARCLPEALLCTSTSGEILEVNRPARRMLGQSGRGLRLSALAQEEHEELERYLRMCSRSRSFLPGTLHLHQDDGSLDELRTWGVRLELEEGAPKVLLRLEPKKEATAVFAALNRELAALRKQQRELNKQRSLIRKQQAELLEFVAPMIDVWDGVLLVPLMGALDETYFNRVLANVLDRVASSRTRWVILDLTGTPSTEALMAVGIVRIARTAKLLGVRCVLAGLGPGHARFFATHAELPEDLTITRNLHAALAMCLHEQAKA